MIEGRPMSRRLPIRAIVALAIAAAAIGIPVVAWVNRTETACGVVVGIEQASITQVTGFSLRTADGVVTSYAVVPARLGPGSFEPGHLREHRALATPICVTVHPLDSPLVALDLRDAPSQ